MNFNTISPYVRRAMRSTIRAPFRIGQRVIFDYEIVLLASGKFLFTVDGVEHICRAGDVILIRPGHPHIMQSIDGITIEQPHIHFDLRYDENSDRVYISFKDLPQFSAQERAMIRRDELDIGPILTVRDRDGFSALLYEIIRRFEEKAPYYQLDCKEKMIALLKTVFADNKIELEEDRSVVSLPAMIKHYIDYNFYEPIDLDSLEKQFGYSRFHISRVFSAYTGTSVIKYSSRKRTECAKEMLRQGATVSKVAEALHFSSIYHFSRFFKNETGLAPSEYARKGD
ncbi:MAG: helix-turn-helix transcriptional regulator [Clostridia bacterium]|nr:helix-turn-helix transcriptional regulator [Clostridia bacterium]